MALKNRTEVVIKSNNVEAQLQIESEGARELQQNKSPACTAEELLDAMKVKGVFVLPYLDDRSAPVGFSPILEQQAWPTTTPPSLPKRQRGRPKKNPQAASLNDEPSVPPAVENTSASQQQGEVSLGWCTFKPLCSKSDWSYLAVHSPAPSTASPPKLKRGRPRKNPSALSFSPQPAIPPAPETSPTPQTQQAYSTASPPNSKHGRPRKHQPSPTVPTGALILSDMATLVLKPAVASEHLTQTKTLPKNTQSPPRMDKGNKKNSRKNRINLDHTLSYENDPKKAALENNLIFQLNRSTIDKENPEPSTLSPQTGSLVIATTAEAVTEEEVPVAVETLKSTVTVEAPASAVGEGKAVTALEEHPTLFESMPAIIRANRRSSIGVADAHLRANSVWADPPVLSPSEQAAPPRCFGARPTLATASSKRRAAVAAGQNISGITQHERTLRQQLVNDSRLGAPTAELAERREALASANGGLYSTRTYKRNTHRVTPKENHNKGNEKKKQRIVKVSIDSDEVLERTGKVAPGYDGGLFVSMSNSSSELGQPAPDLAKFLGPSPPGSSIKSNANTIPPTTTISTSTKKRAHQSTNIASNAQTIGMMEGCFTEVRASTKDIKKQPTIEPLCFINTKEDTWVLKSAQYEQAFKAQCHLRLAWFTGRVKEDGGAEMGGQTIMAARDGEIKVLKNTEYEKFACSQRMTGSTGSSFVLPFDVAKFKINGTTDANGVSTYRIPTKWMIYIWFEPTNMFWPPINLHQVDNLSQEGQKLIKHRKATVVKDVKVWARSEYDMDSNARQRWKVFTSVGDQGPKLTEASTKYELAVHVRWPEWCLPSLHFRASRSPSSFPSPSCSSSSSSRLASFQANDALMDSSIEIPIQEPDLTSHTPPKKKRKTDLPPTNTVKAPVRHNRPQPVDPQTQQMVSITGMAPVPEVPEASKVSHGHPSPAKPPPPPVPKGRPEMPNPSEPEPKKSALARRVDSSRTVSADSSRANTPVTPQHATPETLIPSSAPSSRSAALQEAAKKINARWHLPGRGDKVTWETKCRLCDTKFAHFKNLRAHLKDGCKRGGSFVTMMYSTKSEAYTCNIWVTPIGKDEVIFEERWPAVRSHWRWLYRTQKPEEQAAARIESEATITETPATTDTIEVKTEDESIKSAASKKATAPVPSPVMAPSQPPPQPTQPVHRRRQMEGDPAVSHTPCSDSLNRAAISTGSRLKPAREIVTAYWGTKPPTKHTSLSQKQKFFDNFNCIICNSACALIADLQAHMLEAHKDLVVHYEKDQRVDHRLARWAIYAMRLTTTKVNKEVCAQIKNKDETVAELDKLLEKGLLKPTGRMAKKDNDASAGFAGARDLRDVLMAGTSDDPFVEDATVMGAANSQLIQRNNEYVVPPLAPAPVPPVRSHPIVTPDDLEDAVMEDAAVESTIEPPVAVPEIADTEDAVTEDAVDVPLTGVQPPVANEVAAVEPDVVKPAQPRYNVSVPPPLKPFAVPGTLNGRKLHDHVTHTELIPGELLSSHLIDTQWQQQNNNDDFHMTTEFAEDEQEFAVVWDEFVRADPARRTASQISFEALKTLVINNWLWLHQRKSRILQLVGFLRTLTADAKVTNDALRKTMTLFIPPHVEEEAYKRVERDTAWTAESLEKNAKCRDDLWTLLKWLWERSPNPLEDPVINITRAQYINVATPMLHTHDVHTLNMTINLFIQDAVFVPKRRVKNDDSLHTIEVSGSDALRIMHNTSLAGATGEYRAFHDAFERLKAKKVDVADIPGRRWKFLMAFRSMHIKELVARWEWRRLFEIECHVTHVSKKLAVEQLLEFLAALRSMGGTTDPKLGPDTHPLQIKLAVSDLKPQELKDAPIYGKRISIPKPQQFRTPLECKCGREVMASGGWVKCRNDMWPRAHKWMCAAPYYHQECAAVSKLEDVEKWHCDDCVEKRWLPMETEKKVPAEVNVEDAVMEDRPEPTPAPAPMATRNRKLSARGGGKQGWPAPKKANVNPVAKLEAEIQAMQERLKVLKGKA